MIVSMNVRSCENDEMEWRFWRIRVLRVMSPLPLKWKPKSLFGKKLGKKKHKSEDSLPSVASSSNDQNEQHSSNWKVLIDKIRLTALAKRKRTRLQLSIGFCSARRKRIKEVFLKVHLLENKAAVLRLLWREKEARKEWGFWRNQSSTRQCPETSTPFAKGDNLRVTGKQVSRPETVTTTCTRRYPPNSVLPAASILSTTELYPRLISESQFQVLPPSEISEWKQKHTSIRSSSQKKQTALLCQLQLIT